MPQISELAISNGASTPVSKTFVPHKPQQGENAAVWYNKDSTTPIGYRRITVLSKQRADGGFKVDITIADPVLAEIDGQCCVDANVPQVSYTDFANMSFVLPRGATIDNRKDILAFAKNLLGTTMATAIVVNNEVIY